VLQVCAELAAAYPKADAPKLLRWVRLRALAEARTNNIGDLIGDLGVSRSVFYTRTTAIARCAVARSTPVIGFSAVLIPGSEFGVAHLQHTRHGTVRGPAKMLFDGQRGQFALTLA
jgi:hypothetical protein